MLKRIKKLLKKSPIQNERGNVMSVAILVIVVLTYAMTTITSTNVSLIGFTNVKLDQLNEETFAKGLINQTILELQEVDTTTELDNFVLLSPFNYGPGLDVVVTDLTGTDTIIGDFSTFGTSGIHESRVFEFAYTLLDGKVIYRLGYISNGGTATENLDPFSFSISTNGNLVMNSGYYDITTLYGNEVLMASVSPYIGLATATHFLTPDDLNNGGTFPLLTPIPNPDPNAAPDPALSSTIYATTSYTYCETTLCFNTNSGLTPFGLREPTDYQDVVGSALEDQGYIHPESLDFFSGFDYDAYTLSYIKDVAPTDARTIVDGAMTLATAANDIDTSYTSGPTPAFTDISVDPLWDFSVDHVFTMSAFWNNGPLLTISHDVTLDDTDSLFVNGDLVIDNQTAGTINLEGTFIVTGDLYFTGDSVDIEGTFFVLGETFVNFSDGEGFVTQTINDGFSILGKDNIKIEELFVSNAPVTVGTDPLITAFFYTEESIWIDAVNGRFHLEGALFARALGNTSNQIFLDDNLGTQIEGIVINGYRGYVNSSDVSIPSQLDVSHRFYITKIDLASFPGEFRNIPTFNTLTSNINNWVFEPGEFKYE